MTDQQPTTQPSDWDTETGLLTNYEGSVVDAWFGTNQKVQGGKVLIMFWKLQTDDPDNPEVEERWTCGGDWITVDGGLTAQHPSKQRFNKATQYGHLIDVVAGLAGDEMRARGSTKSAETWIGTKWFMEAEEKAYDFKDAEGKEVKGVSTRNYPTAFLGTFEMVEGGELEGPSPAAAPAAPAAPIPPPTLASTSPQTETPPPTSPIGEQGTGNGAVTGPTGSTIDALSPENLAAAKILAQSLPFHDWVDKMLEQPWVRGNNELIATLADEATYNGLKG